MFFFFGGGGGGCLEPQAQQILRRYLLLGGCLLGGWVCWADICWEQKANFLLWQLILQRKPLQQKNGKRALISTLFGWCRLGQENQSEIHKFGGTPKVRHATRRNPSASIGANPQNSLYLDLWFGSQGGCPFALHNKGFKPQTTNPNHQFGVALSGRRLEFYPHPHPPGKKMR